MTRKRPRPAYSARPDDSPPELREYLRRSREARAARIFLAVERLGLTRAEAERLDDAGDLGRRLRDAGINWIPWLARQRQRHPDRLERIAGGG